MDVGNKFELHYYLNNDSHQLNALLRNRCEAELLAIISEIALILDVDAELLTTASMKGGFREFLDVLKGNTGTITVLLLVVQLLITATPMFHETEQEELEKELSRLHIEESKLNIEKLRKEVRNFNQNPEIVKIAVQHLTKNIKIIKRKSNFYSLLNASQDVNKVGFAVLDTNFRPLNVEIQILQPDFKKYILQNNKLKSDEVEAEIEIISPVLKEGKYKWRGIYNEMPISFDMLDVTFRDMVLLDNIPFQHGSSIVCVLRIGRELDEVGDVKVKGYAVTTVIEKIDDGSSQETLQGKKYRHNKQQVDGQGKLFS